MPFKVARPKTAERWAHTFPYCLRERGTKPKKDPGIFAGSCYAGTNKFLRDEISAAVLSLDPWIRFGSPGQLPRCWPISGVLFCDFSRHSAKLSGEPSKVLGISEMIHLFSAFSPKQRLTVGERLTLIHVKSV
jgi:hypothetical protein